MMLLTHHPPVLFPNSLGARVECLGPCGAEQGEASSGKLDPRTCRTAGSGVAPLSQDNPHHALAPSPQPPGFRVEFGTWRGLGVPSVSPFLSVSCLWGFCALVPGLTVWNVCPPSGFSHPLPVLTGGQVCLSYFARALPAPSPLPRL